MVGTDTIPYHTIPCGMFVLQARSGRYCSPFVSRLYRLYEYIFVTGDVPARHAHQGVGRGTSRAAAVPGVHSQHAFRGFAEPPRCIGTSSPPAPPSPPVLGCKAVRSCFSSVFARFCDVSYGGARCREKPDSAVRRCGLGDTEKSRFFPTATKSRISLCPEKHATGFVETPVGGVCPAGSHLTHLPVRY